MTKLDALKASLEPLEKAKSLLKDLHLMDFLNTRSIDTIIQDVIWRVTDEIRHVEFFLEAKDADDKENNKND